MNLDAVLAKIDDNMPGATDRLLGLLRLPSISTDPAYKADCDAAADWLVTELQDLGIDASKRTTSGHPMVVGHTGDSGPHILFYGHYDVQPVDPIELWDHDPFDPVVEETASGRVIRGRGTADDKGQFMTFIEACRAWKEVHGSLPGRITFLFEGEEECSSPSLVPFLQDNAKELHADFALICDTAMHDTQTPAIVTMLRGLLGEGLEISGPDKDLHSGYFGGAAINPIRVLADIIAGLHDDQGRITIPGFYDGVPDMPPALLAQWDALDFDPATFLGDVGLSEPAGETGRSVLEMMWARPTCDVNGIWGGYTGDGFKTVLPAQASAKISFRLVGTQDPLKIRAAFREQVRAQLPPDCSVTFSDHGASAASQMSTANPAFEKARNALSDEWPKPAAYIGCGGSIPIAGHFRDILGMDSLLIGFGQADDQLHSPNEKYNFDSFHKGTRSWARILQALNA